MSGLDAFVKEDGANRGPYHLMNIECEEQFGETIIHLWVRDEDDKSTHISVVDYLPSFYISDDAYNKKIKNHDWVEGVEIGAYESINGVSLTRVYCRLPKHVSGDNDTKGLVDYFDETWEGDISPTNQFLNDVEIDTHFTVDEDSTWTGSSIDSDYRTNVDALTPVEGEWKATPRCLTVDIEVESPDGFPEPEDADHPVTAITAYDNHTGHYTVWALRHDSWDCSDVELENLVIKNRPSDIQVGESSLHVDIADVEVHDDESELLDSFNQYVERANPDLLSGWNSSASDSGGAFDYPYLINRCKSLNVFSFRDWSPMGEVWDGYWGPGAKGIEFFDMMQAYKKTRWSEPDGGYGLANVSGLELGDEGKLDLEDLDSAWKNDISTFLQYNIRDVQAVIGIDKSSGTSSLFQNLRKLTGAQWGDTYNNIDLLDHYILGFASKEGVVLPTNEEPDRGWFYGGYVFEPELGRHPNAVYPDVWSEYPNAFRTCNMSPETLIGTEADLQSSEYAEADCRWSYIDTRRDEVKKESDPDYEKCYYLKPEIKEGFMNKVVDHVMGLKDDYNGTELYGPVKQVVNSVWGVYGDSDSYGKGYRLFDWRVAESITLYGRQVIQHSAEKYVDSLNVLKDKYGYDGPNAYQAGGDTDSVMTSIPFMDVDYDATDTVELLDGNGDTVSVPEYYHDFSNIVDLAMEACELVNDSYDEFAAETFNSDGEYIELEIESYAPWLFIPEGVTKKKAKKRYAEIIAWDEGDWEDPPVFSATGIDIVRSDRATVTRELLEDVLDTILRVEDEGNARDSVYDVIQETVEGIQDGDKPYSYYARPKGMSDPPSEYGSPSRTPMPTYKGAKYAQQNFDWENLTAGSKPKLLYLDRVRGDWPRTYSANTKEDGTAVDAVALDQPDKLPDEFSVDTDKMIEKTIEDPLRPILSPLGWSFDEAMADTQQATLAEMM